MKDQRESKVKLPLIALKDGESGVIISIGGNPARGRHGRSWGLVKRLMDLGLTPGTQVTVMKSAPFHGPVEILVRGSRLALGRGVADRVLVERNK